MEGAFGSGRIEIRLWLVIEFGWLYFVLNQSVKIFRELLGVFCSRHFFGSVF